jgi:2',3'-cyclic-nucleotide 2'-phosphodiesterase (5'-nucleotidase family)
MPAERLKPIFLGAFLILHTNDLHGRLQATQDPHTGAWVGGVDRIARVIQEARAASPSGSATSSQRTLR